MKKKRRTELDIDPSIMAEREAPAAPEKAPAPTAEEAPKHEAKAGKAERPKHVKKINYLKLLTLAGLALGLLTVASVMGYAVMTVISSVKKKTVEKKEPPAPAPAPAPADSAAAKPHPGAAHVPAPAIFQFKPFMMQIGGAGGEALVSVDFAAEMSGPEVAKEIERNLVLIRENIYFLLQEKTLADFQNESKRRRMAIDTAIAINRSIQSGAITRVLITNLTIK